MDLNGYIEIEPHTLHKYSILRKYLNVCKIFDEHYSNFVYVDTHGGSGKVYLKDEKELIDGSPLIAASWKPNFPCHIVEINSDTFESLCKSTESCENVNTYHGDCNDLIHTILAQVPKGKKFVFCYVDPSALVYRGTDGVECEQLRAETIQTIARFPRSELLLNFPIQAILRCAGDYFQNPEEPRAQANGRRVTGFMGSEKWQELPVRERSYRDFLELYIQEQLDSYPYKGAILVRSEAKNLPVYYLVYTTNNRTAARIMRDIMNKEGDFPIHYDLLLGRAPTFDEVYPLDHYIFEN